MDISLTHHVWSRADLSISKCHCVRSPCFCQCVGLQLAALWRDAGWIPSWGHLLAELIEKRRGNSHLGLRLLYVMFYCLLYDFCMLLYRFNPNI